MTWNLRKELKELLAQETGTKIYAPGQRTPVAFLYPNTYHLGMSNLGLHILYQVLDSRGWAVERFFLPGRRELPEYVKTKTPLLSVENQRALSEFPYICATMCFELDYVHLLEELRLGRIVLTAADRGEQDSFVVVGGPCATFNPEPLADFVDCFVIGEGEETLPRLLDLLERLRFEGRSRAEKLAAAARLPGIYVFHGDALPAGGAGNHRPSVGPGFGRVPARVGNRVAPDGVCRYVYCRSGAGLRPPLPFLHGRLLLPQAEEPGI